MAQVYVTPGVYVEEVDKGTKPIEALGTSTAAFIGITERVPERYEFGTAVQVTSWAQYTNLFGEFTAEAYLPDAVYGYFNNGGGVCFVTSLRAVRDGEKASATIKSARGKGQSLKVTARHPGPAGNDLRITISNEATGETETPPAEVKAETGEKEKAAGGKEQETTSAGTEQEFTLTVAVETEAGSSQEIQKYENLTMKKLQEWEDNDKEKFEQKFKLVVLSDIGSTAPSPGTYALTGGRLDPLDVSEFLGDVESRKGLAGLEAIDDVGLVLCPDIMAGYDGTNKSRGRIKAIQGAMVAHCERMRYCFALLDMPPGLNAEEARKWYDFVNLDSSYAATYYPWLSVADLTGRQLTKFVPPSGYMAGIYNRVDSERGVHKAPANEVVQGAFDVALRLTKEEQGTLNIRGINCIRSFPGRGIRVWGGRTLSSDGSWRYINVRRLFINVGKALDVGLQWVVFEPNDHTLWAKVRRDVTSFLRTYWLNGALFGTTPEQAFYVKCDEELNPPEIRDLGRLIIEIGLAPVKPAEFVIIRLSQWAGPNGEAA